MTKNKRFKRPLHTLTVEGRTEPPAFLAALHETLWAIERVINRFNDFVDQAIWLPLALDAGFLELAGTIPRTDPHATAAADAPD